MKPLYNPGIVPILFNGKLSILRSEGMQMHIHVNNCSSTCTIPFKELSLSLSLSVSLSEKACEERNPLSISLCGGRKPIKMNIY
jgi:hypothetical protein